LVFVVLCFFFFFFFVVLGVGVFFFVVLGGGGGGGACGKLLGIVNSSRSTKEHATERGCRGHTYIWYLKT